VVEIDFQEELTQEDRVLLKPFVSNLDGPIFVLQNLPEVIKGALFSRYSRSTRGLRKLLVKEFISNPDLGIKKVQEFAQEEGQDDVLAVQRANDFYQRILDGFGDDSVGELGGCHLAMEDVSNLATKVIQDLRIGGSPLEKSSRYVWFHKKVNGEYKFYRDPKILGSEFREIFLDINNLLFDTYSNLVDPMMEHCKKTCPREEGVSDTVYKFTIRAKACDALRGLLPVSTLTNMGVFGNGRFFEYMLLRLRSHQLTEMNQIADKAQTELNKVISAFVKRSDTDHRHFPPMRDYFTNTFKQIKEVTTEVLAKHPVEACEHVELVEYDQDAEVKVVAGILYQFSNHPKRQLLKIARAMSAEEREKVIAASTNLRQHRRHRLMRGFENTFYTFDIIADYGAYRDMHRHRMLTQQRQHIGVSHGFIVPPEIKEAGFEQEWNEVMKKAAEAYNQIFAKFPDEAQYVVPFGYRIRWYNKINLRALAWMIELRSIRQGHPNYRRIAQAMFRKMQEVHPVLAKYGLQFVDMNDYALARLEAEKKQEQKGLSNV